MALAIPLQQLPPAYEPTSPSSTTHAQPPTYTTHTSSVPRIIITPPPSLARRDSTTSINSETTAPLPIYTARATTEPHTLSRSLFHWGFLCPLLWVIGVAIIWIELKVMEAEDEATGREGTRETETEEERLKRERERLVMDETIGIMRKAELRWSRYCAIALSIEFITVLVVVGVIVGASMIKG